MSARRPTSEECWNEVGLKHVPVVRQNAAADMDIVGIARGGAAQLLQRLVGTAGDCIVYVTGAPPSAQGHGVQRGPVAGLVTPWQKPSLGILSPF